MTHTVAQRAADPQPAAAALALTPQRLRELFEPRSVALVGASDKSSWSWLTYGAMTSGGFTGAMHFVNPRSSSAHGQPTVAHLADIDEPVDLAFVMVPQAAVLDVLEGAAEAGIRNAVVLTSGFAEAGPEGREAQAAMSDLAARHDLAIVGPNTLGFMNLTRRVIMFPTAPNLLARLRPGPVALVSQSGALGGLLMGYCSAQGIGLSLLAATGNEAVVTVTDVIDYLIEDEATDAIAVFAEAIRRPDELLRVSERALAARKPIVALKAGRSEVAARTAAAHTGALVGDDRVVEAVFRQAGIIRVDSLEQLMTAAALLAHTGPLPSRRVGVAAISGGACDLIADRCEREGIELPDFAPETIGKLGELLPTYGTPHNPLDVTGAAVADPVLFGEVLRVIGSDPSIDVLVCQQGIPPADGPPVLLDSLANIASALREASVPSLFTVTTGEGLSAEELEVAARLSVPLVGGGIDNVFSALGRAMCWSQRLRDHRPATAPQAGALELPAPEERRGAWPEHRARELLAANGVSVVPAILAADASQAVRAGEELGYPVVLKVASPDLLHKSDVGGIRLGLRDATAVRAAYDEIMAAAGALSARPRIEGVLVSPMRSGGVEVLVGVVRDPVWGHVLAVGLGGIWTEIFADASLRVLPVADGDVRAMLKELRGAALLDGARGAAAADLEVLVEAVLRVASLAHALRDDLESLEVNPFSVDGSRVEALDALITWHRS